MDTKTRSLAALALITAFAAVPSAASAADLYVEAGAGVTTCAQDDPCSLPQAITIADIVSNADTIHVDGPLAYSGAVNLANSPIALIGSGRGTGGTSVDAGAGILRVGADSSVRALSVHGTGNPAVVLEAGGSIRDARVDAADIGILKQASSGRASTIDDVDVIAVTAGIVVEAIVGGDFTTIHDAHLVADFGIVDQSSAHGVKSFQVERSTVEASRYGIYVLDARATIANSVIRAAAPGAIGVLGANTADIDVDGTTIDGGGLGSDGVRTRADVGATVVVNGSIVRRFDHDLSGDTIRASYSVSVSGSDYATTAGSSVGDLGGNVNADPHWLDAANGDYRLAADSPLIDRGPARAAALGETDRAGSPRLVDGNGDGVLARDIGAFEYQPGAVGQPTPGPSDPGPSTIQDGPAAPGDQQPATTTPTPTITRTPTPTPTQPAAPQTPTFAVRVGKLALNARGRGSVAVTCSARPCSVKLVLASTAKRPHTLARATGSAGTVNFQLSSAARTYVKKHRIRKVAVTATAIDTTGRRTQVRQIVRLP
jgi:hypothetical protein